MAKTIVEMSLKDLRHQVYNLIDAHMSHKALIGRTYRAQKVDGLLGELLEALDEMKYDKKLINCNINVANVPFLGVVK